MIRPTSVVAREGYRIGIRYSDGVAGEIDLSHLAGRGVFDAWADRKRFESVHLTSDGGIAWSDDIELCPDALYLRLTGKSVGEVMPGARASFVMTAPEPETLPGLDRLVRGPIALTYSQQWKGWKYGRGGRVVQPG